MLVNMRNVLEDFSGTQSGRDKMQLPDIMLDTEKITAMMINEVVPTDSNDDFYSRDNLPDYLKTTLPLF